MKRIAALILLACLSKPTFALDPFVISDIRIDGLQRISPGTVFTYLPVEQGDNLTRERAEQAVRSLFKTGFFNDIQLSRQGDILVITVKERPSISKLIIKGNKDIKEDDLRKGLKDIGLTEGETFDRLSLDRVTQELTRQYYNRGKYNVSIKPKVIQLDRNRVDININIAEGKASRIKHINIVGNNAFTDKQIQEEFDSDTSNWTSWYSRDDQYSREKLGGDLEKLSSYYMDRGYVDFNIDSTEVTISPDKRNIYITANVREGEIYKISDIKLAGNLILEEEDLTKLITIESGETFSRAKLEKSAAAMTSALSNIGYAFAEVSPLPAMDKEKREVAVNFFVNPGKRVYVRRINFKGNVHTEDEVIRREMRQLEGAWYSQAAIDRSKVRLQRLGYFKKVDIETPKVPGTEDQVDINIALEEQAAGSFQFGLGYSAVSRIVASISLSQNNFLGTGDKISLNAQKSAYVQNYGISYLNPYLTDDGVSLGYNVSYRKLDQAQANLARYFSNSMEFNTYLGLPVTENDTVNVQLGVNKTEILTGSGTPRSIVNLITDLDRRTFHAWKTQVTWAHDTRNKYWNPTRGSLQQISAEVSLPGSTLEYYKFIYRYSQYLPISDKLTFFGSTTLGFGDSYRDAKGRINPATGLPIRISGLPFFENFYAGGASDVRGFRDNTLGPCEIATGEECKEDTKEGSRQYLGGAFKTLTTAEVVFPTPGVKDENATRLSAFVDIGNVYKNYNSFNAGDLRASAGISFRWQAPVGPIVINLSQPLRKKEGDQTEAIQFTFGSQF